MIVDSQCHVSPVWYEPVESLLQQMTRAGVSQAILIQLISQIDNRYQQHCLTRFPGVFASVVWIDPVSPRALDDLHYCAEHGASGVRLRPTARSPGADPLAIWRYAESCGFAVSCVGNSTDFLSAEFAQVVTECPDLVIALEHLGDTSQPPADQAAQTQRARVVELARFENVYLKVPGLGELMRRKLPLPSAGSPFEFEVPEVLGRAIEAFGPRRLMWGSDFPVVSSREGYGNSFELLRRALDYLPQTAVEDIFGGTARRVFKLATLPMGVRLNAAADR